MTYMRNSLLWTDTMSGHPVFSTCDGQRLLSLQYNSQASDDDAQNVLSALEAQAQKAHVRDALMLDLRLETCFHGRLTDGGTFGSLLVLTVGPVAEIGEKSLSTGSMTVSLEFDREIRQESDGIEVLQTGEDCSLTAQVSLC